MRTSSEYRAELDTIRERVAETIKLKVTKLFKNHSDLANEICFAELDGVSNPVFQQTDEDFSTTCIDDIRVEGNDLTFTYSSEILDLQEGEESELTTEHLLQILFIIEDLTEDDLEFDE